MGYVLAAVIGYIIGSISFSFLFGKWFKGIDIRKHGSGNAGATNTLRVMGLAPALSVLALDIGKGILAVWIGRWISGEDILTSVIAGFFVIVGHNWPVFFAFRGGKGIATTIGVVATLFLLPSLIAGVIAIAVIFITRYVSLGSLLLTALLPIALLTMGREPEYIWLSLLIAILAFYRHRSNIIKIVNGTEHKLSFRSANH